VTTVWTIGHSTRSADELVAALSAHAIAAVVDVRAVPGSRRHPQFGRAALDRRLAEAGVRYLWMGEALGGRRSRTGTASRHTGLRVAAFVAFAEHMETPAFARGVDELLGTAALARTAVLCAERRPAECHRSLIADFLTLVRGVAVEHVDAEGPTMPHRPHRAARAVGEAVVYDGGGLGLSTA
jgi:uncharacterized protein (DUF488 family)